MIGRGATEHGLGRGNRCWELAYYRPERGTGCNTGNTGCNTEIQGVMQGVIEVAGNPARL